MSSTATTSKDYRRFRRRTALHCTRCVGPVPNNFMITHTLVRGVGRVGLTTSTFPTAPITSNCACSRSLTAVAYLLYASNFPVPYLRHLARTELQALALYSLGCDFMLSCLPPRPILIYLKAGREILFFHQKKAPSSESILASSSIPLPFFYIFFSLFFAFVLPS